MDRTYWQKQTKEPLFPDLIWSRPESKQTAGKLLIIGGNIHGFAAVGQAFTAAQSAGIGQIRLIMPNALRKTVSKLIPEADYAASSPSGSFSQQALAELLDQAGWADGVLIAGDLGRNSETAILLEKFSSKFKAQLTFTKDAVDYFINQVGNQDRANTQLVVTMAQLQSLARNLKLPKAFRFDMDLLHIIDNLHELTTTFEPNIILKHLDQLFVAIDGKVSTTKTALENEEAWRVPTAATAAVWWLQNPNKPYEAITSSLIRTKV